MKNKRNLFIIITILSIFMILLFPKEKLNCFVANYQLRHNNISVTQTDSVRFFMQFKNTDNTKLFKFSLIELGGYGCKPCMRIDTVINYIRGYYKGNVNIKVYRVTSNNGRKIAKYFGVNAIPTQIIINKNGIEKYRHTGFISKKELSTIINKEIK